MGGTGNMIRASLLALILIAGTVLVILAMKSKPANSGNKNQQKPPLPYSQINCSAIPNKLPNMGNPQTPPFFRCMTQDMSACYDIGVSPLQKGGWYVMTGPGEDCTGVPLCKDVATKCNLGGLGAIY